MHGKHQPKQHQTCQQPDHRQDSLIEAGVRQAENDRLSDHRETAAGELMQLSPEPAAEEQLFRQAHAEAEQNRIEDVSAGELSQPSSP